MVLGLRTHGEGAVGEGEVTAAGTLRWRTILDTRTSPFSKGSRPLRELQRSDFHLNVQIIHM